MPTPRARRRRAIIEVVVVSAMLVGTQWWNDDRREHAMRTEAIARIIEACRSRNTGNELGRRNIEAVLVGAAAGSERSAQYIEINIRPLLAGPAEMDRDCDGNGYLTDNEYDGATPEGLPIVVQSPDQTPED